MNETLKKYVCEKCGGELSETSPDRFLCRYCRTEFFKETSLPDELILDLHSANRERSLQRFEDALNEYDRIIDAYPDCFDAYWGATLSDYGIQYEKDYDGRMIPTVHRFSETPVTENAYFLGAVRYCKDAKEKERIEESALEIERIRAQIKKTVGTQKSYDIFLCYKETPIGGNGGFTSEFYWADELYRTLRGDGYKVFFAKQSLPASKGDYEAHIFPALRSAKLMLILTTSVENLESVWVKNEWSRFLRFAKEDPTAGKRFKVIQSGFRPENLPRELRKEQVLNHDSMGWVDQLYSVIRDTFRDEKKEAEERRRREADELEARIAKSSEERIRELERKLEEERKARFEEEEKKREEEAKKRLAEEAKRNEERIRELERQLADAMKKSTPSTAPQSSGGINSTAASRFCSGCGTKLTAGEDSCPMCGTRVSTGASRVTPSASANATNTSATASNVSATASNTSAATPSTSNLLIGVGSTDVVLLAIGTNKLDVIKVVRESLGLSLLDAKNLVESAPVVLKKGLSASDAETFRTRLTAFGATVTLKDSGASADIDTGKYDVIITKIDGMRLNTINVLKTTLTIGLKEAKDLTENLPRTVSSGMPKSEAEELRLKLEKTGANVELKAIKVSDSSLNRAAGSDSDSNPVGATYGEKTFSNGSYKGYLLDGKPHGKGVMTYNNGNVYDGEWVKNNINGKGKYTYANGNVYDGDWKDGKMTGRGSFVWNEAQWKGDRYEGDWLDGKRTGRGRYAFANGNVYEGDLVEGKVHGNGKMIFANKDVYEGDWLDGKRTGRGRYAFANGNVYEGDFVEGKMHGNGKMIFANGCVYEGEHKNNDASGKGKMIFANKDVYEGDWIDGKRTGRGRYAFTNGNVYEGDFVEGKMHGNGKLSYKDGTVKEGRFENNVFKGTDYIPPSGSVMTEKKFTNATYKGYALNGTPHGKGVMKFNDGAVYDGEYEYGSIHGKGTYVWKNGNRYSGDWYNGKMNGYGVYTYADGRVLNGRFESGVFKGNK